MKSTLIGHFFNEAGPSGLLGPWTRHHARMFDHAILFDYASTDGSADLVRSIAPHWEVRQSRNAEFDAMACETEVHDADRSIEGWRIILNTTEFLVSNDFRGHLENARPDEIAFGVLPYCMADRPESVGKPFDAAGDIIPQRFEGYFEGHHGERQGYRFLHRGTEDDFSRNRIAPRGRNSMEMPFTPHDGFAYLWYGWAPWPHVKQRKLQIQTRIPQRDKEIGYGVQHIVNEQQLDERFVPHSQKAFDLRSDPRLLSMMQAHYPCSFGTQ